MAPRSERASIRLRLSSSSNQTCRPGGLRLPETDNRFSIEVIAEG